MPRKLQFLCFSQFLYLGYSLDNADEEDNFYEQEGISFTNTTLLMKLAMNKAYYKA